MFVVKSCGCMSLRAGSLIMAYMNAIFGTLMGGVFLCDSFINQPDVDKNKYPSDYEAMNFFNIILILFLVTVFLYAVLSVVLVCGLHMNNRSMIRPYLFYSCFILVISAVISFSLILSRVYWILTFGSIMSVILLVTSLIIVNSYSKMLLTQPI